MIRVILFLALVLVCCAFQTNEEAQFSAFMTKYNKKYKNRVEFIYRLKTFRDNLEYIHQYNARNTGMTLGVTEFADMTNEEYNHHKMTIRPIVKVPMARDQVYAPIPDSFNWEDRGVVGEVKNQGQCGSSLVYASVDSICSAFAINSQSKYIQLDPDQVSGCSPSGCSGEDTDQVMSYIEAHGLAFNYTTCPKGKVASGVCVKGYACAKSGNETDMAAALVSMGPLFVEIDASSQEFQLYETGIYDPKGCSPNTLDLSLLVVGYAPGYWICQNSWGTSWGMDGYIWVARGSSNECGIASEACFPTGVSKC